MRCLRWCVRVRSVLHRRVLGRLQVGRRLLDEPRPAADRAERVDDPVVLGEVPGVRRGRRSSRRPGRSGRCRRRPARGDRLPAGRRRRSRDRARPRNRPGRGGPGRARRGSTARSPRPSRPRYPCRPAPAARRCAPPRPSSPRGASRARPPTAWARRRDRRTRPRASRPDRRPPRPRCPGSRRRRTARRRGRGRGYRPSDGRALPGRRPASAIGSMTVTRQPAATPSAESAPAMGVVPTTQSCAAGRCGST